jgi:hypothetical protein
VREVETESKQEKQERVRERFTDRIGNEHGCKEQSKARQVLKIESGVDEGAVTIHKLESELFHNQIILLLDLSQ